MKHQSPLHLFRHFSQLSLSFSRQFNKPVSFRTSRIRYYLASADSSNSKILLPSNNRNNPGIIITQIADPIDNIPHTNIKDDNLNRATSIMPTPPQKRKRKSKSKDNWYYNKQKQTKEQQKQQRVNNTSQDDECSITSTGGEKNSRRSYSDQEISEQSPHPGSFASLEMRKLYGYPEVLVEDAIVGASDKLPKRKVVFLIAYLGQNYCGFQINEAQRTVQAEIEYALYKSKFLDLQNFGFPTKYSWATSARTDKNVHACAQVCNAKIRYSASLAQVRETINSNLPSDICILDVVQTSKNFNAKTARNKVKYQYMLPSFVLQDSVTLKDFFLLHTSSATTITNDKPLPELTSEEASNLYSMFKSYRATSDQIHRLNDALKQFEGTHSFHNYTRGRDYDDKSTSRFIMTFVVGDPIISEQDGMEWIPTHVTGQSFLLNQIRKMISMAIDVARGSISITSSSDDDKPSYDFMMESFSKNKMQIDIAPAQGLFLEMSYFDYYNQRSGTGKSSILDWSSSSATADSEAVARWKHFKEHLIMPHIMKEEGVDYNFINYMYVHEFKHTYYNTKRSFGQQQEDNDEEGRGATND